jgi:hypothetical protein
MVKERGLVALWESLGLTGADLAPHATKAGRDPVTPQRVAQLVQGDKADRQRAACARWMAAKERGWPDEEILKLAGVLAPSFGTELMIAKYENSSDRGAIYALDLLKGRTRG